MLVILGGVVYIPQYFAESGNSLSINQPTCIRVGEEYIISDEASTAYGLKNGFGFSDGKVYTGFALKDSGKGCLTMISYYNKLYTNTTVDGSLAVLGTPEEREIFRGLWLDNLGDDRKTIEDMSRIVEYFNKFVKWHALRLPSFGGTGTTFNIAYVWYGSNKREHKLINKMNRKK